MIAIGILSVFAVLACHWLGIYLIRRMFETTLAKLGAYRALGSEIAFALAIFGLVMLNFVDVLICALLVMAGGSGVAFVHAFHFAIANFTTVGLAAPASGSIAALAGPLIAMCGIVSFGWSTSFLVSCSRAVRVPEKVMISREIGTAPGSVPPHPSDSGQADHEMVKL